MPPESAFGDLQERHGFGHIPLRMFARDIAQAVGFYYYHENPPTPKKRADHLFLMHQKADDLLHVIREGWGAFPMDMIDLEPQAFRALLTLFRDNAAARMEVIRAQTNPHNKQSPGRRRGIDNAILYLAQVWAFYKGMPPPAHSENSPGSMQRFSGPFVAFIDDVFRITGISESNYTIGAAIKRLLARKAFPRSPT